MRRVSLCHFLACFFSVSLPSILLGQTSDILWYSSGRTESGELCSFYVSPSGEHYLRLGETNVLALYHKDSASALGTLDLKQFGDVRDIDHSANTALVGMSNGKVLSIDLPSMSARTIFELGEPLSDVASINSDSILIGSESGNIYLLRVDNDEWIADKHYQYDGYVSGLTGSTTGWIAFAIDHVVWTVHLVNDFSQAIVKPGGAPSAMRFEENSHLLYMYDGGVKIYNPNSSELQVNWLSNSTISHSTILPQMNAVILSGPQGTVVQDIVSREILFQHSRPSLIHGNSASIWPLIVLESDRSVAFFKSNSSTPTTPVAHGGEVLETCISYDGTTGVSNSHDYRVKVWDLETGYVKLNRWAETEAIAISPDAKYLAIGRVDSGVIEIVDIKTGKVSQFLRGHRSQSELRNILDLDWSNDGAFLVSSATDSTVLVWETSSWSTVRAFRGSYSGNSRVSISPNSKYIAFTRGSRQFAIHSINGDSILWGNITSQISGLEFTEQERYFIASGSESVVWEIPSGEWQFGWGIFSDSYQRYLPSSLRQIGTVAAVNLPGVFDLTSRLPLDTLRGREIEPVSYSVSASGKSLLVGERSGAVSLWSIPAGKNDVADAPQLISYVFPNPASSMLEVRVTPDFLNSTLLIVNALGQVVHSQQIDQETISVGVSALPNGSYLMKATAGIKLFAQKVLIKR